MVDNAQAWHVLYAAAVPAKARRRPLDTAGWPFQRCTGRGSLDTLDRSRHTTRPSTFAEAMTQLSRNGGTRAACLREPPARYTGSVMFLDRRITQRRGE